MDAMYLNLMFINPRPPVGAGAEGAGAEGARCTRPSLTPPLQKILDPPLDPYILKPLQELCYFIIEKGENGSPN